jgi:adenosylhomocysteine nucleosidase
LNGLGIVSALTAESRLLGASNRRDQTLSALADGTLLVVTGMGRAAAERGAQRLVAEGARALMSFGLAGGLDPALVAGTLLLPEEVISPGDGVLPAAREWRERLSGAVAASCTVCGGKLLTCLEPIASPADKAIAFRQSAAVAVDLESYAVAAVAARHGLPFLAVRAIADTARDGLPRSLTVVAAGAADVPVGRLLGALVRAPGDVPGFIRLVRRYSAARRALKIVARSGALAAFEPRNPGRHRL